MCNCQGIFIDRSYWVSPNCAPFRIMNPATPQYAITVRFFYGESFGVLNGTYVPGSAMTVGSGFSPDFAAPAPFNPTTGVSLSWLNGTSDGFAVTQIETEYDLNGGYTTELRGTIMMCDNGNHPYCTNSDQTDNTQPGNLPTANINVTDPMGVVNPWARFRGNVTNYIPLVPLPDFIFDKNITVTTPAGDIPAVEAYDAAWWYYLSAEEKNTVGIGCGQNGWTMNGVADTASSHRMCAGPQGTCVPGIDKSLRGESVVPPCSIAANFLDYVNRLSDKPAVAQTERPRHVPNDWTPDLPNYAVHRGKLFNYGDVEVTSGRLSVNLRISVAADFEGVEIAQSGGTITAVDCFISSQSGNGQIDVIVTNTGNVPSEYAFVKGSGTTSALTVPRQSRSIAPQAPTTVTLNVQTNGNYGPQDADSQFLSVVLTPSLYPDGVLGQTDPIQCVPQYGLPDIKPIITGNVALSEQLADTFFFNEKQNPTCGIWCGFMSPFHRARFFTSFEIWVMTWVIILLLVMVDVYVTVVVTQRVDKVVQTNISESQAFKKEKYRIEAMPRGPPPGESGS
jgi:hypothetical protein